MGLARCPLAPFPPPSLSPLFISPIPGQLADGQGQTPGPPVDDVALDKNKEMFCLATGSPGRRRVLAS